MQYLSRIPLLLTASRLFLAPIVMPILILAQVSPLVTVSTFFAFALTDFFDGYLARRYGWESKLGTLLDPVADKILILSTALALVRLGAVSVLWAVVVVNRELLIMGLREVALLNGLQVMVSWWGKFKTAAQMIYIVFVLGALWPEVTSGVGFVSLVLTVGSGLQYFVSFWQRYRVRKVS